MVKKLVEFPNFFVFNSGTESFRNISVFAFSLLMFTLYRFLYLNFRDDLCGVSNVNVVVFLEEPR
jgi:hypothetical protein